MAPMTYMYTKCCCLNPSLSLSSTFGNTFYMLKSLEPENSSIPKTFGGFNQDDIGKKSMWEWWKKDLPCPKKSIPFILKARVISWVFYLEPHSKRLIVIKRALSPIIRVVEQHTPIFQEDLPQLRQSTLRLNFTNCLKSGYVLYGFLYRGSLTQILTP